MDSQLPNQTDIKWIMNYLKDDLKPTLKNLVESSRSIERKVDVIENKGNITFEKTMKNEGDIKELKFLVTEDILNEDNNKSLKARVIFLENDKRDTQVKKETIGWTWKAATALLGFISTILGIILLIQKL